jgi:hypothetical protein
MKYVVTEQQYNLISEALGIPENIYEAAVEFYDIFLEDIKSITEKESEYEFDGDVDITIGSGKVVKIKSYRLVIDIAEIDGYDELPQVASMGMGQQFMFDRDIQMKRVEPSTNADFTMTYGVSNDWEPHQLYDEFLKNREEHISSLAHELKHKYDKQVKNVDLIGLDAEYAAVQSMPSFEIRVLDKFRRFLYYTNVAENLVRSSEVGTSLKIKNITQDQFREFLKNNPTFQNLVEIKNFTYEKLMEGLYNSMDKVDEVLEYLDTDISDMSEDEKVNLLLKKFYIGLSNTKMEKFDDYIEGPMNGLLGLFRIFGGFPDDREEKISNIRNQFIKHVTKYKKNPIQFYKDEINTFHKVADKMIKKLSKLYALTQGPSQKNESIIEEDIDFNKTQLRRRINSIEELIYKEIEEVQNDGSEFSDEFEFADNIISWVTDKLMGKPEYENFDYDDVHDFIKEHFGDMILEEYIETDFEDEDDEY